MQYGRYRIEKELGKGNMGVVYQALDPQIERKVALKVLREDRMVSEDFVMRFVKEAKAIGRLSHPNIVTVYDVGQDHGTIYIAMEYLEGRPFDEVIRGSRLALDKILDIGVQVAETLDYAHKKKIVHRDIKPSNMILSQEGRVKLTDFGIARIEDTAAIQQTQAGEILGTPVYMPPEQATGAPIDGRADLYSLGVILYELIVGKRPFDGSNITAILRSIIQDTPEAPSQVDPFIPQAISDLIMKCLSRDPEDRFQTGAELSTALKNAAREGRQKAVVPVKKPGKMTTSLGVWLVLGVIALAGIGAGWYFLRGTGAPPFSRVVKDAEILDEAHTPKTPSAIVPEGKGDSLGGVDQGPPTDLETADGVEGITVREQPDAEPPMAAGKGITGAEADTPGAEQTASETADTGDRTAHKTAPPDVVALRTRLIIESRPPGSQVFIGNNLKGLTPLKLELPLGEYNIRLRLADHYEWKADIELSEAGEVPLFVQMVPID